MATRVSFCDIRDDGDDAGKRGDLVRAPRRVAAGDDDPRARVVARGAANRLARALSAVAVTEQLLTTITSASADGTATPPRARRSRSMAIESAWFTRQPNVRIEYFIAVPVGSGATLAKCLLADVARAVARRRT